jgi:hypothetical protein
VQSAKSSNKVEDHDILLARKISKTCAVAGADLPIFPGHAEINDIANLGAEIAERATQYIVKPIPARKKQSDVKKPPSCGWTPAAAPELADTVAQAWRAPGIQNNSVNGNVTKSACHGLPHARTATGGQINPMRYSMTRSLRAWWLDTR